MNIFQKAINLSQIIILFCVFYSDYSRAGEFAVSPMMIELTSKNRTVIKFEFNLFGKSNTNVKLELFDMMQMENGYMEFAKSASDNLNSMTAWIKLEDNHYRLRDGESVTVRGEIRIPVKSSGSHLTAIMVEEDLPAEEKGGVVIKIRYAVILNLTIEGRRQRLKTEFDDLTVVVKEDGTYLEGFFTNHSTVDEKLFSQVQLRDENNRLIERVALKSESSWQRNDAGSRIFPGAKVRIYGKITKSFSAGTYKALVRNNFGSKSQPVYRQELTLSDSQDDPDSPSSQNLDTVPVGEVSINPETVIVKIRSNGSSFTSLTLSNSKNESVSISLPTELEDMETQGISDFTFFPSSLVLRANQESRVILKQSHIEGVDYGNISFLAKIESTNNNNDVSIMAIRTIVE